MSIAIWEYNPKCPSGHFFLLYFPSIYKLWKSYIKYNINKMCATLGIINRYSPILDWMEYKKNKNDQQWRVKILRNKKEENIAKKTILWYNKEKSL